MANKRRAVTAAAVKTPEQKPLEVRSVLGGGRVVRRPFNKSPNGWMGREFDRTDSIDPRDRLRRYYLA